MIILLGVLSLYFFINPSEFNFFPKCPLYSYTGIYCAGCGSQRAIHQIVNGNIITGIRHNYLLILVFGVLSYKAGLYVLNNVYNKTYNDLLHKPIATKIILILVLIFWALRNINVFPFTELAP
ncbi:MAG: DUF2752 domain-containing protein [Algicola sp.]|nr:DUF2752 domain-containing protein [Algicola sp.]